eukprot:2407190-Amphidinium_carterae.1
MGNVTYSPSGVYEEYDLKGLCSPKRASTLPSARRSGDVCGALRTFPQKRPPKNTEKGGKNRNERKVKTRQIPES